MKTNSKQEQRRNEASLSKRHWKFQQEELEHHQSLLDPRNSGTYSNLRRVPQSGAWLASFYLVMLIRSIFGLQHHDVPRPCKLKTKQKAKYNIHYRRCAHRGGLLFLLCLSCFVLLSPGWGQKHGRSHGRGNVLTGNNRLHLWRQLCTRQHVCDRGLESPLLVYRRLWWVTIPSAAFLNQLILYCYYL